MNTILEPQPNEKQLNASEVYTCRFCGCLPFLTANVLRRDGIPKRTLTCRNARCGSSLSVSCISRANVVKRWNECNKRQGAKWLN